MSSSGRFLAVTVLVAMGAVAAGCGTTDPASQERLPPIRTTTPTTTTAPTTIPTEQRYYTIKSGDTLAAIAASFQVPVIAIVDLNGLDNPDDIQAGQTIEIPSGVILVEELPEAPGPAPTTVG